MGIILADKGFANGTPRAVRWAWKVGRPTPSEVVFVEEIVVRRILPTLSVIVSSAILALGVREASAQEKETPKAAATRKKLETKVTVKWKDALFRDIIDEVKELVPGVSLRLDLKGGISNNRKFTYAAKDKPLKDVLTEMLNKEGLGWYVISKEKDAYDGTIWVKLGKERGYPEK
jgi:hypothetical protein